MRGLQPAHLFFELPKKTKDKAIELPGYRWRPIFQLKNEPHNLINAKVGAPLWPLSTLAGISCIKIDAHSDIEKQDSDGCHNEREHKACIFIIFLF